MQQQLIEQTEYALSLIDNGDEEGVDILYRCMGGRMLIAARAVVSDAGFAEDVVQESFIKVVKAVSSYRKDTNPCAWVLKIVRNTALNFLKKQKRVKTDSLDEEYIALISENSFEEQSTEKILVRQLMLKLTPPVLRKMIYMKYFLGMTVREIARELSVSKSYVSKQIIKAEQIMRDNLK